jgi:hypothetical protein
MPAWETTSVTGAISVRRTCSRVSDAASPWTRTSRSYRSSTKAAAKILFEDRRLLVRSGVLTKRNSHPERLLAQRRGGALHLLRNNSNWRALFRVFLKPPQTLCRPSPTNKLPASSHGPPPFLLKATLRSPKLLALWQQCHSDYINSIFRRNVLLRTAYPGFLQTFRGPRAAMGNMTEPVTLLAKQIDVMIYIRILPPSEQRIRGARRDCEENIALRSWRHLHP